MLRYFYLLCLLVCIEWCFCYEYIYDHRPLRQRAKEMKVKRQRRRNERVKKAYEVEDKDALAHIDVASFIQQPDYDTAMNNYNKPKYTYRKSAEPNYDSIIALGSINGMSMHLPQMNARRDEENRESKRKMVRQGTDRITVKAHMDKRADTHEKKCSMKQVKFPFFSHKKTVSPKSKKIKKKKLSWRTKTSTESQTSSARPTSIKLLTHNDNIIKRSYEQAYCPLCKRKVAVKRGNSSAKKNKMIHNSRQFYQNSEETQPDNSVPSDVTERKTSEAIRPVRKRRKRHEKDADKERQLKELEEVQQKVDSMETGGLLHKVFSTPKDLENLKEEIEMR